MQIRILVAVVVTVLTTSAAAQTPEGIGPDRDDVVRLHDAATLRCEFENITAETIIDNVKWELANMGSARVIGAAGSSDLMAVRSSARSSFIEITPAGAVNLITIYAWTNAQGRFVAVYSRHTAVAGPSPSQVHGSCVALPSSVSQAPQLLGSVELPRLLRQVNPHYTAEAMEAGVEGTVVVDALVLPDGSVGDVTVVESLDTVFGLDDQAVRAVRQWLFQPGTRFGEPVAMPVTLELFFSLR